MNNRLAKMSKLTRLLIIAPLAIIGMVIFAFIGGELVKLLWNAVTPPLFGFKEIGFWQALGLLALCRILFGGLGLGGGQRNSRGRMDRKIRERIRERMGERWEEMTPEEREKFRGGFQDRAGGTTPLDPNPNI
jgi:hypothetical protein